MATRGVAAVAAETPERVALVGGGRRVSFAELDEAANRWAQLLSSVGVGHGDRVAVMLTNRPELFAVWYGAGRLGALVVPVSYRFTAAEAGYVVGDSGAKAFVHESDELAAKALDPAEQPELALAIHVEDPRVAEQPGEPPTDAFLGTAVVQMNYTSGTTGRPKGIARPLPEPAKEMGPQPFTEFWGFRREDVHLLCGPAYHTAPGNYALMHLNEGAPVVIMGRFDADECLRLIQEERVTTSHMVPANFVRILEVDWARYDRSSVRKILHAAAPCPVAVKRRIMEVFPPGSIWEYFGMSEGFGTTIGPEEWLRKPGSVGTAFPGITLKILSEEGEELGPGEVGQIYVSSAAGHRFEYHNATEKTTEAWKGDFYTVGDMGYLDEEGYLFIADRRVDLIISGGVNIYPAEIEQALAEHDDVVDAAVFGLPDERMGQRVHALVELRPEAPHDEEALLAFLRDRLALYKLPRQIEFVDELPREPSGKVLKRQLREERLATGGTPPAGG